MILKLGMQHQRLKFYKVYKDDNPGLSLTYFTEGQIESPVRLNAVKQLQLFNGENLQQRTKLTECIYKKNNKLQGVVCPCPGAKYMYIKN